MNSRKKFSVCQFNLILYYLLILYQEMKTVCKLLITLVILSAAYCQQPPVTADLATKRNYLLTLMNNVRLNQNTGLVALYLDVALNGLAQGHSNDMVKRNFFDHINPDGLGPQQRATAAGFNYSVGQNIAYRTGTNLTAIHTGLMGSAPHFANTIKKEWTRAGVGIAYKNNAEVYVTIVFSSRDFSQYPLTSSQRQSLVSGIKSHIVTVNLNVKTQISQLSTHINNWLIANRNPPSVFDYLRAKSYPMTSMSYSMAQMRWSTDLVQTLKTNGYLKTTNTALTKYGVGVQINNVGLVTIAVVFSA